MFSKLLWVYPYKFIGKVVRVGVSGDAKGQLIVFPNWLQYEPWNNAYSENDGVWAEVLRDFLSYHRHWLFSAGAYRPGRKKLTA